MQPSDLTHISSLYTSYTLPWLLFFLLVCVIFISLSRPHFWKDCLTACISKMERRYTMPVQWLPQTITILFTVCSLSMAIWVYFYNEGELRWNILGMILLGVSVWLILHNVMTALLGYIFSMPRDAQKVNNDSTLIITTVSILCFLLCSMATAFPMQNAYRGILFGCFALYIVCLLVKLSVTYMRSLRSMLYIVLYILTLEVIPISGIFALSDYLYQSNIFQSV